MSGFRAAAMVRAAIVLLSVFTVFIGGPVRPAAAHVPDLPTDGGSLDAATRIEEPNKSWVVYGFIRADDDVRYYRLDTHVGDTLWLSVMTPEGDGFTPALVLMGPGLTAEAGSGRALDGEGAPVTPVPGAPPFVDVPPDAVALHYRGVRGEPEYEPFTPGAYYFPVELDIVLPDEGPYYVAVHGDGRPGAFALAVGREERFSPREWALLPVQLVGSVYPWSGQSWSLILAPGFLVAFLGLFWAVRLARRRRWSPTVFGTAAIAAGLLSLVTAGITAGQAVQALARTGPASTVLVTLVFIALQMAVGAGLIGIGLASCADLGWGRRIGAASLAVASVLAMSGYIIGPVLAALAAVAPPYGRRDG